jgi:rubredoxin
MRPIILKRLVLLLGLGSVFLSADANAEWRPAGPIWNNLDAQRKCPSVCGAEKWDGNWRTTEAGKASVCSCSRKGSASAPRSDRKAQVDAGPIFNNMDAQRKCPGVCGTRKWDGNWRTTSPGRSTCDCVAN